MPKRRILFPSDEDHRTDYDEEDNHERGECTTEQDRGPDRARQLSPEFALSGARRIRVLPQAFPPSGLVQRPIVQFLTAASAGLLGEMSRLLNQAAELAIRDHSERILLQHLEQAAYEHA